MWKLAGFVLLAILGVGVAYLRSTRDNEVRDRAEQVRTGVTETIMAQPWYVEHADRLKPILESTEQSAYMTAYTPGRRSRRAKFDERKYVDLLFAPLLNYAQSSGKPEFDFQVRDLHLKIQQAVERGEDW